MGNRARHIGKNLGALTFPEIVGKRFNCKFLQGSFGLLITVFMPIYASVVIIGAARMIESTFNLNFNLALIVMTGIVAIYVLFGGLLAVLYTDALQGTIIGCWNDIAISWNLCRIWRGHRSSPGA